jgi:hypothetical protein
VSTKSGGDHEYDMHLDDKYGSLQLIDIPAEIAAREPWFNQTPTTVNDPVVRPGMTPDAYRDPDGRVGRGRPDGRLENQRSAVPAQPAHVLPVARAMPRQKRPEAR